MSFRASRILKSRIGRSFCIALLLAAAWVGWWIAPPWPDWRVDIGDFDEEGTGAIAADGRSFIWRGQSGPTPPAADKYWQRIFIHELPDGILRNTIDVPTGIRSFNTECPTGDRLAYSDHEYYWHLVALPCGEVVKGNFVDGAQDFDFQRLRWSPDGRFFILDHSEMPRIWRSDNGKHVMNAEAMIAPGTDSEILADSSGLVALSADGTHIVFARFKSATLERVPLPAPPVGPRVAEALPKAGAISSAGLTANADGSRLVMIWHRYDGRGWGYGDFENILACWDRATGRWRETTIPVDRTRYDYAEQPQTDKEGKYVTHSMSWGSGHNRLSSPGKGSRLYDLSADPIRSLIDHTLPGDDFAIAKELDNVICSVEKVEETLALHVHDTPFHKRWSIRLVGTPSNGSFSANKQWLTFCMTSPNPFSGLSNWLPDWLETIGPRSSMTVVLLRLTDGAIVRQIVNRNDPMVTNDGVLWTVHSSEVPDHKFKYILEHWSHEVKTPWWLLLLTAAGATMIAWDMRRAYVIKKLPPPEHSRGDWP